MKQFSNVTKKLILSLSAMLVMSSAFAQSQTRILVGYAPGGTTDILARLVADGISKQLGTDVIVENRPGASGNIAAAQVATSRNDGKTILFAPSSHATNATLYKTSFDTAKDFSSVGLVAATPYVLVVHPSLPATNVAELIAYLKTRKGEVAYASASSGTAQHLAGELFKKSANVDMLHVPYKGSAAAFPDLAAGRTPIMFDNIAVILPHIKSGAVRAIAVTSAKRSALLPDVPTVVESGLPNFEMTGWFGMFIPSSTDVATLEKLNAALNKTINEESFQKRLQQIGADSLVTTPKGADKYVKDEISKWHDVIKSANISIN
jgi:tripartite-type tricarboxylate transporter receptor subunit TctC